MIHKLKVNGQKINFKFINSLGSCEVEVDLTDLCKEGFPKMYVTNYMPLHFEPYNFNNKCHIEIIKRIGKELADLAQSNDWRLWSY